MSDERKALKPEDVPAWVQIQGGHELADLVRVIRFAPGQPTGFLHSEHDAEALLWRWALKWAPRMASPSAPAATREEPE